MSDDEDFKEFKGTPEPEEEGITPNEIVMSIGTIIIIAGFVLGLIRLMALSGGLEPNDYDSSLEQLYLSYVLMFIGIIIISILGFGSMFKRAITSFVPK